MPKLPRGEVKVDAWGRICGGHRDDVGERCAPNDSPDLLWSYKRAFHGVVSPLTLGSKTQNLLGARTP
jgi:hypothetical protein